MDTRGNERPEGERTSSRVSTAWRIVRELLGLLALWAGAVYVLSRTRGDVTAASITITIGCFVALLAGLALESALMRKAPTLWLGCLILAAWAAWLPFSSVDGRPVVVGLLGLGVVGATSGAWRARNQERERVFLSRHPAWGLWRSRVLKVLVAGMILGVSLVVVVGIWNSVSVV